MNSLEARLFFYQVPGEALAVHFLQVSLDGFPSISAPFPGLLIMHQAQVNLLDQGGIRDPGGFPLNKLTNDAM